MLAAAIPTLIVMDLSSSDGFVLPEGWLCYVE
jgi:hypothetical protein